ncbi:ABC transporter permease [Desulfatitalea alkaliphila]|uniref:ABC transporter permease subunit n=1 Tax=Desulfatitalea alkaliphila TaxID=2929485 RepID=A0AA41R7N2_9BACT|nr:ABC transporter permease subunit [Desulfatitalea alkaliphila]MCJ8503058.1 ABC transporter permease subunit [Desulfatitalea alkaliphila]
MGQIWLLAKITFKEGVRNRIIIGILFFAFLLSLLNLIFAQMFTYDLSKVSVDLGLSMVSIAGLAIIFFMGINLLSRDFEKRTIYMVISRPIARWQYVLGKYLGLILMIGVSVAIIGGFAAGSVKVIMHLAPAYVPPDYSWGIFGISLLFSFLSLLTVTALAQFFTSMMTSSYIALLLTACAYFIGQNVEIVRKMLSGSEDFSTFFRIFLEAVTWIFPNLSAFDLKTIAGYGLPLDTVSTIWSALYGIGYIGLILILTVFVFQRREVG